MLRSFLAENVIAEVAELVDLPTAGRRAGLRNMYTVYALKSKLKNYIYVGMTADLIDREKSIMMVEKKQPDLIDHLI